ncbi:heavy-metal-associated domain-containing protein [Sunxiuqinia elliptica]
MKNHFLLMLLVTFVFAACNSTTKKQEPTASETTQEIVYHVEGMTCDHCESSIQKGVAALDGISLVEANHEDSTTRVVFDPSLTNNDEIIAAIKKRGYQVTQ